MYKIVLLFLAFILSAPEAWAQEPPERIKYRATGELRSGKRNGQPVDILKENVVLTHKDTRIYGDSAYIFKASNSAEVFGKRVLVEEGDTITITGKKLTYDDNTKNALMEHDVVYQDPTMTLYTDYLDYDMEAKLATYYDGGRLVDEENTLTSIKGYYQTDVKFVSFKEDVLLVNPEYTIVSDTLQYNTNTKVAYVKGPSTITSTDSTILLTDDGEFQTTEQKSNFRNGIVETDKYILYGDRLFADDIAQYYNAQGNVKFIDKQEPSIITGNKAESWKITGITKIYEQPLMRKPADLDTLYLSADTLISIDSELDSAKRMLAYNNVLIFKDDLQGKADSLAYQFSDSLIFLYKDPILWSDGSQITGDTINLEIREQTIHKLNTFQNSFVISQDTMLHFNQIKGKDMTAYFETGQISQIDVFGNSESIYYVLEEGDSVLTGLNKIICSNMRLLFDEGEIVDIAFFVKPDGKLIPPHEIEEMDTRLKGFAWLQEQKPTKDDVINHRRKEKITVAKPEKRRKPE